MVKQTVAHVHSRELFELGYLSRAPTRLLYTDALYFHGELSGVVGATGSLGTALPVLVGVLGNTGSLTRHGNRPAHIELLQNDILLVPGGQNPRQYDLQLY